MSRVHQAIRKAEREHRGEPLRESSSGGTFLQNMRPEIPVAVEPSSESPDSRQTEAVSATHSEPANNIVLSELRDSKLVALSAPKSVPSEQYRTLKTKLFQMRSGRNLRSILVTSAVPSDGKTLTAVNLALTIAQEIEQRVLLIDCDLRRPSVHKTLGFPKTDGLADFLSQTMESSRVVLPTNIPNLCVVPAGTIPDNPAELLNTQKMKELLASMSLQFDWVIVDSPPIVPFSDAELLSSLVDGTLLVVRVSRTPAESLTKAAQALKNGNILGVVFNGTQAKKHSSYYYYSFGSSKA
jgi:exopolysaccharide/PEP-CTERM locus tyrosine autokinase